MRHTARQPQAWLIFDVGQKMKLAVLFLMLVAVAYARLGETRDELVARLGRVRTESHHSVIAQGAISPLGPALFFHKDQWHIQCDLAAGRCARITYTKKGEWTEAQFGTLLENNSQGKKWNEAQGSSRMIRKWRRNDGASAKWQFTGAMEIISPEYEKAKAAREAELAKKAKAKPDL